jgi:GNAT superfamily N-acetyltransferase
MRRVLRQAERRTGTICDRAIRFLWATALQAIAFWCPDILTPEGGWICYESSLLMTLRELRRAELGEAAHLLGCGMCDNPANVRAFRISAKERRARALERFFYPVLGGLHHRGLIYGAFREGSLVGVCGMARPTFCQPTGLEKLGMIPSVVLGNPASTILRLMTWAGEWARRDLAEPHWHLGPVAVDPQFRGQGIGTAMLTAFCSRMDDLSMLSYLETDKCENVRFYRRLGFDLVAEADVLGVPNWFMSRPAGAAASVV